MKVIVNGEEVGIVNSPTYEADQTGKFEIRSDDTIELLLTESGETDPAGRFRIMITGDQMLLQRSAAAGGTSWTTIQTLDGATGTIANFLRGAHALGIVRFAGVTGDEETITIGSDVYEFDTHVAETLANAGAIRLDVSGGSTVHSQGTLTMDTQPTATDTVTVGSTTYTWVASGATSGQINVGADLAAAKVNFVAAINGTDGINSANAEASAAAFVGNDCVLTALEGGTDGDAVATTETFTAGTNVFDAATLGTTTAGVDPTAGESSDAFIAAVNASGTEAIRAIDISANEVLLVATSIGAVTTAISETMATADNTVDTAALRAGQAVSTGRLFRDSRVPNATEVALGNMHFVLPFDPTVVIVQVQVTATGAAKAWDGDKIITVAAGSDPAFITVNNDGATDFAATDTVQIIAIE